MRAMMSLTATTTAWVRRALALTALLTVAACGGSDDPTGTMNGSIRGTVTDNTGATVANAAIALTGNGQAARTANSAADGSYTFSNVPPGTYSLAITAPTGFAVGTVSEASVTVASGAQSDGAEPEHSELLPGLRPREAESASGGAVGSAVQRPERPDHDARRRLDDRAGRGGHAAPAFVAAAGAATDAPCSSTTSYPRAATAGARKPLKVIQRPRTSSHTKMGATPMVCHGVPPSVMPKM